LHKRNTNSLPCARTSSKKPNIVNKNTPLLVKSSFIICDLIAGEEKRKRILFESKNKSKIGFQKGIGGIKIKPTNSHMEQELVSKKK
jgi:hypothetical protein